MHWRSSMSKQVKLGRRTQCLLGGGFQTPCKPQHLETSTPGTETQWRPGPQHSLQQPHAPSTRLRHQPWDQAGEADIAFGAPWVPHQEENREVPASPAPCLASHSQLGSSPYQGRLWLPFLGCPLGGYHVALRVAGIRYGRITKRWTI